MERSRSKRNYYYDDQNYEGEMMTARTSKPRYNTHQTHQYGANNHHHRYHRGSRDSSNSRAAQQESSSLMVTTSYRILCHDVKMGGVIGKSGSIIKAIRQHTGAWINVHELKPGDEERIIEITDTRRRDPEGRMPAFSPAQEALTLVHERILETEGGLVDGGDEEDYDGMRRGGNRVVTRLVVSRMHVGCLMGKGGKIIEQMRIETKTQIRILPRDHSLPRCVSMSEEIVQVVGDMNNVKNAIAVISSRLRESQHRDRSHFQGRVRSPERFFRDDDYTPHNGNGARRSPMDFGSRGYRKDNYSSRASSYTIDSGTARIADDMQPDYVEGLVFRILCPIDKIDSVVGESDSIVDLLLNEIGVDVRVTDPVSGSDEQVIMISSGEGPDDELFPAQEALLHIQTRIVDLSPDEDNIITTRLLVPFSDMECLEGKDGPLSEIRTLTGANIQILPREERPRFVSRNDEIVQIVGSIKAARDALIEVTTRLRSYSLREFFQKCTSAPLSAPALVGNTTGMETDSSSHLAQARDSRAGSDPHLSTLKNVKIVATSEALKEARGSSTESLRQNEGDFREDVPSTISRISVPLVTRSTLEVVLPEYAVPKLIMKSKNKLAQISELSGANVTLLEDRPESTQKIIKISGTPEQAERAQSLLQGFILSTQDE